MSLGEAGAANINGAVNAMKIAALERRVRSEMFPLILDRSCLQKESSIRSTLGGLVGRIASQRYWRQ